MSTLKHLLSRGSEEPPVREVTPDFARLGAAEEARWAGTPCLFVLSTGRAGTMTIARALDRSPDVESYHEPIPTLAATSAEAFRAGEGQYESPGEWDRVVDASRAEYVALAAEKGRVYVETNNRLSYLAPTLARFFSGSRFVFLHRHPVEVVHSGLSRHWYDGHSWDWCRIEPRPEDPLHAEWSELSPVEKSAWLWSATNEFILDALGRIERDRWMEVRSADLFRDGVAETNRILRFLDLPELPERALRSIFREHLNAGPKSEASIPAGAREILRPTARRLGYEI